MKTEYSSSIEHCGTSPPEQATFSFEGLSREQIMFIGKALTEYEPESTPTESKTEEARRFHERCTGYEVSRKFRAELNAHLAKNPMESVGWLIQTVQSGDGRGASLLVHGMDAIATKPDERGRHTPEMNMLVDVLLELETSYHYAAEAAMSTLDRLNADGFLTEEQHTRYFASEQPS